MSEQQIKPFEIKVPVTELQKKKLFIAIPMYGGKCEGITTKCLIDLGAICKGYNIPLQVYFLFNESLIPRARNYCCDEFVRSDATHLMFIDSDIGFNPNDVIGLLAMQSDESPYDIIGAAYPKKTIAWEKIKTAVDKGFADEDPEHLSKFVGDYVFNPKGDRKEIPIGQPVEVLEIGTGFMMIRRKTLNFFKEKYPQYHYRPDHVRTEHFDGSREIMMYFQAEIDNLDEGRYYREALEKILKLPQKDFEKTSLETILENIEKEKISAQASFSKRYLSEDYWFCQKAQAIGMKTWLCPWMQLQHAGSMIYGGSLADLAALGASATADVGQLAEIRNRKKNKGKK